MSTQQNPDLHQTLSHLMFRDQARLGFTHQDATKKHQKACAKLAYFDALNPLLDRSGKDQLSLLFDFCRKRSTLEQVGYPVYPMLSELCTQ